MKRIGSPIVGPSGGPLPLSAAIEADGFVFVSGQIAMIDGKVTGNDVASQTAIVIDMIERILGEAGLGLAHVVRTGIWLTRAEDFASFNAVYAKRFSEPHPARATVVSELVVPGALVEIDAVAHRAGRDRG